MLSTHLTAVLALASVSGAAVLTNTKRDGGIVRLAVKTVNQTSCPLEKRQESVPLANTQTGTRYLISFAIGTPEQTVEVAIDTGSSDTWVNPTCSTADTAAEVSLCNSLPVFTPGSSSTLKDTGLPMNLAYGRGSAQGEYYKDTLTLGSSSITGQQFGVASSTADLPNGFMGVGPGIELTGYPTVVDTLATEGVTNSRAFSLDLRGVDSTSGSIIFGGIDTMKYSGAFAKRPIIPAAQAPDNFDRYWIYLSSIGITKPGAASKTYPAPSNPAGQPVFLDSGGTLSRLPTPLFNAILADFPSATADPAGSGIYEVPCSVAAQDGTMDFTFGDIVVRVPFHEFIWQADTNLCALGVVADDEAAVLGDSFLRAAFVVYDQDNQNLHVAQAADCGTNLVAISSGPDAVPSITGACPGSTPTSSSSSTSSTPTSSSSTSSTTSSPPVTTPTSSSTHYSNSSTTCTTSSTTPTYPASTLSTVYATTTYTISSCAPTVTACPYGQVTTETISLYTTYCPVEATATYSPAPNTYAGVPTTYAAVPTTYAPVPTTYAPIPTDYATYIQSLVYVTSVYTISSCEASVKYCPYGSTTTQVYATYGTGTGHAAPTGSGAVYPVYPTGVPAGQEYTGAAGKMAASFGALVVGAFAGLILL